MRQFCSQELRDDLDVVLEAVRQDPDKLNARATMSSKMSKDVQRCPKTVELSRMGTLWSLLLQR